MTTGTITTKDQFHRHYRKVLRQYAKRLGLQKGQFEVRSNPGGFGIMGDVILHADHLYVNLGGSCSPDHMPDASEGILYRYCASQKDYVGGRNRWMTYGMLDDRPEEALMKFQEVMSAGQ